jgi:pimeloyl-ACP methyl ester carboxylesterase
VSEKDPPGWFGKALLTPYTEGTVEVQGTDIHYLEWGERGLPGLVFVHGGAAHAHWWSYLAPFFAERWHAVALDLSGHGDSGRRDEYSHDLWAHEVLSIADAVGFPGPPVIVGHSLGGVVTIETAASHSEQIAGTVVVDSPVRGPDPESERGASGRSPFRKPGVYPDKESAVSRFRLIPEQPIQNQYIVDHIAGHSVVETDAGWTWKFDPHVFDQTLVSLHEELAAITGRIALLRGEHSVVVPEDVAEYMYGLLDRNAPVASIPDAHHHLIVDQPLAFVSALRTLLADWEHSVPRTLL